MIGEFNMVTYSNGVSVIDLKLRVSFRQARGKMAAIIGVHPPAHFGEIAEENGVLKKHL